ncbi:hypothetical protein ACFS6H_19815 [Terrimonas rubra]|uniref:Ribbon-helix-helix protein CopG domain-containing protein n=1 Tax=Terrimonas rubra TaxID=1035890 RepID=A0ABW6ADC4_9BACT
MLIKELPEPIKKLALKRKSWYATEYSELLNAFVWYETPEGRLFWKEIDKGNYKPFYNLYPQHKNDKMSKEVKTKGLGIRVESVIAPSLKQKVEKYCKKGNISMAQLIRDQLQLVVKRK